MGACSSKSNSKKHPYKHEIPISIDQIPASKEDIKLLYTYEKTIGIIFFLSFNSSFILKVMEISVKSI
jgi:hypothetical protein